ncbi:MAG: ATP-binding cassette domain-containing protein, partial [Bacteroidia bacterium]
GSTLSASKLLSRFNFSPSVQYQYVSTLSGGERRRLYLLTVLIKNPNFLILDEPTNDLDIVTLQTLEDFLLDFKGCVIIVSHDRYFMDKMIDHLLIFEGNGEIRDFPGNYTEYRDWKISQKSKKSADSKQLTASKEQPVVEAKQPEVKKDAKKTSFKVLHEIEELEKDIAQLEAKRKELEAKLSSGITDHVELQKLGEELAATIKLNDEKSTRWLELQE